MVASNKLKLILNLFIVFGVLASRATEYSMAECKQKASDGVAEAQWQLGQRYENGDGVKKNNMRALAQYKKAAEQKHRKACAKLAVLYENGIFVKKDPVQAAKFKAWSEGDNGELAAAQVRTVVERNKEDEIETALDYILGRGGKSKDPKTGIRILYSQAKDKPIAQRVFVDRWSRGDLDEALDVLSGEEWDLLIPWFRDAWDRGNKKTGLVLGNEAYRRKNYRAALDFWEKSGLPKCWYFVGRFYSSWSKEGEGGGPDSMKDETLARKAFERCLRIDSSWIDAKYSLACLYNFAKKKENQNYSKALDLFSSLLKRNAADKYYNYGYGYAGFWMYNDQLGRLETEYKYASESRRVSIKIQYDQILNRRDGFVRYFRTAANQGHDAAREFLKRFEDSKRNN